MLYSKKRLLQRLWWDLSDKNESKYYIYSLISGIPGLFGSMLRAEYISRKIKKTGANLTVGPGTSFRSMENLILGHNVQIGNECFIQSLGEVTIGNNVLIGPKTMIWSVNHNYNDINQLIADQGQTQKKVRIGNNVWIAAGVFILPGVDIPDGVVVGAGSVVSCQKILPNSVIAGNPAKFIKFRN